MFPGASRSKPRFMALAEAVLKQVTDLLPLVSSLGPGFSFASAEGVQLDQLAASVGLSRADSSGGPHASDEVFRAFLLAKLALWQWNGMNETVPALLGNVLPGCSQADQVNGTVRATVNGSLPAEAGKLFPVPAGVRITT